MTDQLLQQAIEAIKSGDKSTGGDILIKILEADGNNEQAWLWLTQTGLPIDESIECLQKVLEINPNNEVAQGGLKKLQERQARAQKPPAAKPQPQPPSAEASPKKGLLKDQPSKDIALEPASPPSPPTEPDLSETKQCPYCAETIKAEAKICRFCGNDLTGQLVSQQSTNTLRSNHARAGRLSANQRPEYNSENRRNGASSA